MPGVAEKLNLLRARDVSRIGRAVRWAESQERRLVAFPDVRKVREEPDLVRVQNVSGLLVPQYGLVWLVELEPDLVTLGAARIQYPGVTMLGIAGGAMPIGAPGWAWRSGEHPVLVSDYAAIDYRRRLSSQAGSFYAVAAKLGLLLHIGDVAAADQPAGLPPGVGLVRARLDRWRPV